MSGIRFLTDEDGRKVAVQINLETHGELWEEFYDALVAEERRGEPAIPYEEYRSRRTKPESGTWLSSRSRSRRLRRKNWMPSTTLFKRVDGKILALADDPRPHGCKKLRGHNDLWRIRIGDYRVVYSFTGRQRP